VYYNNPALLPPLKACPADYPPGEVWTLDEGRGDATVKDICDFIVEYMNCDVMVRLWMCARALSELTTTFALQGLLADRHIIIADQSKVWYESPVRVKHPHPSIGWRIR
jgi:hypothetical protein